jgi:hypothetical protein
MKRKVLLILFGVTLSFLIAMPALADAPAEGLVVEGQSVPGIHLGGTRSQVDGAYGTPSFCQNQPYYNGSPGLNGICEFQVAGGGHVTVHYRDAEGGPADDSPDDVVFNIRWNEPVNGWTTTAGINTGLALADPDAVIQAYPNAVVIYNSLFGNIESIEDVSLGILVDYTFDYLSGTSSVNMAISFPREPVPAPDRTSRVTGIELSASKVKGSRQVRGLVRIQDELNSSLPGATVSARWIFPDGSSQAVQDTTSRSGYAYFEYLDAPRGRITLVIDNVFLDSYQFDRTNSVLEATIRVK